MSASRSWHASAALVPALFVLLWSTGFIGAKLGLPHAEPFTFLAVRMVIAGALLLAFALVSGAPWPANAAAAGRIAIAGLLVHAVYLGGVFYAIAHGLPAGIAALIVGIQPLLTAALAARLLGERVTRAQWFGLALGLAGVAMVVGGRGGAGVGQVSAGGIVAILAALFGITLGTLYQKRHCAGMDLRSGGVIQYGATALALGALAFGCETRHIEWAGEFVFALAWLVLVLSVGAVGLLYTLIRRGEAARVASLFYLTPPVTAVMAWGLFDERLGALSLAGMVVVMAGVVLANRAAR